MKFLDVLVSCQIASRRRWQMDLTKRSYPNDQTENNADENVNTWGIGKNKALVPFGMWHLLTSEKRGEAPSVTLERTTKMLGGNVGKRSAEIFKSEDNDGTMDLFGLK